MLNSCKLQNLRKKNHALVSLLADEDTFLALVGWIFFALSMGIPKALLSSNSTLLVLLDNQSVLVNWILKWVCSVNYFIQVVWPVNEWCAIALACACHTSIYLGMLSSHVQNFIWRVDCMPTLQQVCSVIFLQIIHLQLHVKLSFHS